MLPSNLNLNIGKAKGYNNKIGSNKDINRDHKKLTPSDVPKKIVISTAQHNPVGTTIPHSLKMLNEKPNDEKTAITFLIVGAGLIAYHFC